MGSRPDGWWRDRAGAATGELVLVVTADRGLRARLPRQALAAGPRWLLALLGPPDG